MKKQLLLSLIAVALFIAILPVASAHQPRIVFDNSNPEFGLLTEIEQPDISKAYYGELKGNTDLYDFVIDTEQEFYFNILVPDIEGATPNFSADLIFQDKEPKTGKAFSVLINDKSKRITTLDGTRFTWTKFYEEFAGDDYLKGPETKILLQPGTYVIRVRNQTNTGKYVLATGDIESFPPDQIIRASRGLPLIKSEFFGKSPFTILGSTIGKYLIISIVGFLTIIAALFFLIKKLVNKKRFLAKKK